MADTKRKPFTAHDFRFTSKGTTLFAIALDWPTTGALTVKSLGRDAGLAARPIEGVRLLGHDGEIKWSRDPGGLTVTLPLTRPGENAYVLEISPVDPAQAEGGR
jgi:alpha-L-fucosidase